jgi:hypothetical protein
MIRDGSAFDAAFSVDFEQCYSHVYIQDRETMEAPPRLSSGREDHSAGDSVILIVTRPDTVGRVRVDYFLEGLPDELRSTGKVLFQGVLRFDSGIVSLATVGAQEDEDDFQLRHAGRWRVEIVTLDAPPSYIGVSFAPA